MSSMLWSRLEAALHIPVPLHALPTDGWRRDGANTSYLFLSGFYKEEERKGGEQNHNG